MISEKEKEKMRELRKQGYGLENIAELMGFSAGTVYKYVKDVTLLM